MKRGHAILTGLAVLWLAAAQGGERAQAGDAQSAREQDPVTLIKHGSPEMLAAYARAQSTLPEFLAVLDGKPAGAKYLAIKISFVDGPYTEHMWLIDLSHDGDTFSGTLNDEPSAVENVTLGQQVSFSKSQIEDWHYMIDGRLHGSFTTCVSLEQDDPDEARAYKLKYGLTCDDGT